uniref:RING-type domain-containing protein n=1 Tax=Oryza punctata TaxID=4537 RepID=A0A0E0LKK9_ORYPU
MTMSHTVVDIELQGVAHEDAATATVMRCCAVCMEPLEWVVIGSCGHHVVCGSCIVRVHFVDEDKLCRQCKAPFPLVVVVRGDCPHSGANILAELPSSPMSKTSQGRAGDFWFNIDTAAYFADENAGC